MKQTDYLSIGEFAKLSGVSRKNLIYYDSIDLLKPEWIQSNGYRFYHYHQLYTINMIIALKEIRIPLKEIKDYMEAQGPETILPMLRQQKEMAHQRRDYFAKMETMLDMQIQSLELNLTDNTDLIELVEMEEVPLFYDEAPYVSSTFRFSLSIAAFYKYCLSQGYEFPYPSGVAIKLEKNDSFSFDQRTAFKLYAKVPQSKRYRERGTYLTAYTPTSLNFESTYRRLVNYGKDHQLKLTGDIYIDFISNELVSKSFDDFRLKMMIQAEKE